MTKSGGNPDLGVAAIFKNPSFPRRRESRPWSGGNIQRLAEALEILDSRFHGNDEKLRESRPWDSGNIQRLAEALEILDSRFRGNDEECGNNEKS